MAHALAARSQRGEASTEELRQAMQHYRALFDELVEAAADQTLARGRARRAADEADENAATR